MKLKIIILLVLSHLVIGFVGFALGIYTLPIITAPQSPSQQALSVAAKGSMFTAEFTRELKDSDALHWGEGIVNISQQAITLNGELAPGPNYKLYLSPTFVETEVEFKRLKTTMVEVGDINTFDNFIVAVPSTIDPRDYKAVIVWCESFSEFITAAKYQ